jgi:hypothetical protein
VLNQTALPPDGFPEVFFVSGRGEQGVIAEFEDAGRNLKIAIRLCRFL